MNVAVCFGSGCVHKSAVQPLIRNATRREKAADVNANQGRRSLWDRGDTSPQYLDWGHYHECPPNISRVISATFYPCNIFLIS